MANPQEILADAFRRASTNLTTPLVLDAEVSRRVEIVCRNTNTKALSRLLLACCLAKVDGPDVDIRKPYTEIVGEDTFSGRSYDEGFVGSFVIEHHLPCNNTTAFLTPALRTRSAPLMHDSNLGGRPAAVYQAALQLLTDVQTSVVPASDLLADIVRTLLVVRNENRQRLEALLTGIRPSEGSIPLSAESIVSIVERHLKGTRASRLPVLIVAAAYGAAGILLGERINRLESHNAADRQTGAVGDVEVALVNDARIVTGYEMKMRRVSRDDIDLAVQKIIDGDIQNYIFITTEEISLEVREYAASLYVKTGGVEVVILDCIGFLRHFLHLFHRLRARYVEEYQKLVLEQPDSAVSQPLKELWLALRKAAESDLNTED